MEMDIKLKLNNEEHEQLKEMVKWLFPEETVTSGSYESFTICSYNKPGSSNASYYNSTVYLNYMNILLFLIPEKLGMSFVMVDPENPKLIFIQVYEKYLLAKESKEELVNKSKYKNSCNMADYYACD